MIQIKTYYFTTMDDKEQSRNARKNPIGLKILHTNIRGLNSKKESLADILKQEKPDILTVNELL